MIELRRLMLDFFDYADSEKIELYNEFSFQHEFGIFLRSKLPDYKIQFERNVSYFNIDKKTTKKEIDIVIFDDDFSEKYAIELKAPKNGQFPSQMYSFVKDVKFLEELIHFGFDGAIAVVLVNSKPFYEGKNNKGIYKCFREDYTIGGQIFKPTGKFKDEEYVILRNYYQFRWMDVLNKDKYYIIEIE